MISRKIFCVLILVTAIWALNFAQASADSVLIKLNLKTAEDYTQAKSAGVMVYHRFEDFVLAEFEKSKLVELDRAGLNYEIVDENPWTAGYFLVTSREEPAKVKLESYGQILLKDTNWQLLRTTPEKAAELRALRYSVIPIRHQPLPLEYRTPGLLTKTVYPYSTDIDSLLNLISQDSLYSWDLRLQNFKTRYAYSDSLIKARDWLYDKFVSFGIDSVWLQYYIVDSAAWNVVATIPGTVQPDRVIVVGGHYDSVVYGSGVNPYVWAPGADDNGSGTVATLEMARIIAQHSLPVSVMFVPFDQEEQGLYGSYYFASYLHNLGTNVELMINSDMIGHSVDSDPDVMIYAAPNIMGYVNTMVNMANTYTDLRPVYGGQEVSSDNFSFYQWGFNALCALEGDFNYSGWHTNYDVVDSLNYPYMKEVVKMCLATLLYVSNSPSPVENPDVKSAGDGHTIYVEWTPNPTVENVAHYNVYFGTTSGQYDSTHQVAVPVDTLRGLTENTTYFVT
ncbi:MAG: M28 family peptidase, partial [Candidatus Zixiibacteriota bacterium]